MEENINIAAILKDKPNGLRLYSPIFGECTFCYVREYTNDICVKKHNGVIEYFNSEGLYYALGESMLFPSKEMRDWSKFFNKGDVLVCYEGKKPYYTIFDCFESNTYKDFNGKFSYDSYEDKCYQNEGNLSTNTFNKLSLADSEIYITKIEERFGGKLNHETLEIVKTQPKFKIGDILFVKYNNRNIIFILSNINGKFYNHRVRLDSDKVIINYRDSHFQNEGIEFIRYATEEEKEQLFDALAKECKGWDSEKKEVVDLKPKWTPKPFDRVITRNDDDDIWTANIFSHMDSHGEYVTIGCVGGYTYCIPYNEETAKLIGTTNNVEG